MHNISGRITGLFLVISTMLLLTACDKAGSPGDKTGSLDTKPRIQSLSIEPSIVSSFENSHRT